MKKLILALSVVSSACLAQQNWLQTVDSEKELIYVVSNRPLAEIYGHPLTGSLSRLMGDEGFVYASYLGRSTGGGTSSEQLMHTVDQDIQRMQPDRIILDNVEASSYLLDLLPDVYNERTTVISSSGQATQGEVSRARIKNLAVVITDLIDTMNVFPDKFYILFDSSGLTARDSFQLKKSLGNFKIGSIQSVEISTIQQLDDFLIGINEEQRGVIINNLMSLRDHELNTEIRLKQIKETIVRRNRKHLEIGFNYLPNSRNESIILELDYPSIAEDFISKGMTDQLYDFRLIVSRRQMQRLGLKNSYIAALKDIDNLAD